MDNKRLSKNHIYGLVAILATVLSIYFICYYLVVMPVKADVEMKSSEVSMYEKQLAKAKQPVSDTYEADAATKQIPGLKAPEDVLTRVKALATAKKVTIQQFAEMTQEESSENAEAVQTAQYSLDVQADSLAAINDFLDSLQTSERLILLQTIHITKEGQATATIQIKTYYQGS